MLSKFRVVEIIDHLTIRIEPNWKWIDAMGSRVDILGYRDSPLLDKYLISKLATLINNESVELRNPKEINNGVISCSVYLNGVDIAHYFS